MPKKKISIGERVNAYKYVLPAFTVKEIKTLLTAGQIESSVISVRWVNKKRLNVSETIFKRHVCNFKTCPELQIEFNCSSRKINDALNEVRRTLIDEIMKDVEAGILKEFWKPAKKKPRKIYKKHNTLKDWEHHKNNI